MKKILMKNERETTELGYKLGSLIDFPAIVCLSGDLGAGKTTFVQGFSKGLGVSENITSPTFTIVNEYNGRLKLYHFDVYRISSSDEMYEIGFDEYISSDAVCIIEWAEMIEDLLQGIEKLWIEIKYAEGSTFKRELLMRPEGEKYEKLVEELFKE